MFVSEIFGDDENPGTRDKPVRGLPRGIALARTGRGRVFFCGSHSGAITLPSGVDLVGSFDCLNEWKRKILSSDSIIQTSHDAVALTIEPADPGDTGAADGVSTLVNMRVASGWEVGLFVRSGTAVEIVRSAIHGNHSFRTEPGEDAPKFPLAPEGADGNPGVEGCSATPAVGGAPVMTSCGGGAVSIGGEGGDGGADDAGDGSDGAPASSSDPDVYPRGDGGNGDHGDGRCRYGETGQEGAPGTDGAPGRGIGRLDEDGWTGERAGDGARGAPGQGGGGGGGLRGIAGLCGAASRSGPSGGSGGSGGCGGKGGTGGGNGTPSIGILALHAKVTVRDSRIITSPAMAGADGGSPQSGSRGGRGGLSGYWPDVAWGHAYDGSDGGFGAGDVMAAARAAGHPSASSISTRTSSCWRASRSSSQSPARVASATPGIPRPGARTASRSSHFAFPQAQRPLIVSNMTLGHHRSGPSSLVSSPCSLMKSRCMGHSINAMVSA